MIPLWWKKFSHLNFTLILADIFLDGSLMNLDVLYGVNVIFFLDYLLFPWVYE